MKLKVFLAGGGDPPESREIDYLFTRQLRGRKLLYLIDAAVPEMWSKKQALNWLRSGRHYKDVQLETIHNLENVSEKSISEIGGIYLLGGNTFKLLHKIRGSNFCKLLTNYIRSGNPVLGLSAGAVIFGSTIETAALGLVPDPNIVGLRRLDGFDFLRNHIIATHYNEQESHSLSALQRKRQQRIIAIPEKSGAVFDGQSIRAVGGIPITIFTEQGIIRISRNDIYDL